MNNVTSPLILATSTNPPNQLFNYFEHSVHVILLRAKMQKDHFSRYHVTSPHRHVTSPHHHVTSLTRHVLRGGRVRGVRREDSSEVSQLLLRQWRLHCVALSGDIVI